MRLSIRFAIEIAGHIPNHVIFSRGSSLSGQLWHFEAIVIDACIEVILSQQGSHSGLAFSPFSFVGIRFMEREGVIVDIACL